MNFFDPAAFYESLRGIIGCRPSIGFADRIFVLVVEIGLGSDRGPLFQLPKFSLKIEFAPFEKLAQFLHFGVRRD